LTHRAPGRRLHPVNSTTWSWAPPHRRALLSELRERKRSGFYHHGGMGRCLSWYASLSMAVGWCARSC
jgi:hypothetical protein